ncbi:hypothetical protein Scep_027793 [Stephania cephalantha]|uniref:Uncharacterized protein n=1 Tax=Stephania cephalantha TaxID=152367 RepID=A0AAP0HLG1_9MAGN
MDASSWKTLNGRATPLQHHERMTAVPEREAAAAAAPTLPSKKNGDATRPPQFPYVRGGATWEDDRGAGKRGHDSTGTAVDKRWGRH